MTTLTPGTYAGTALNATQVAWAQKIIDTARLNPAVTDRDVVCALACVAQESRFYMYANDGTSTAHTATQQGAIKASLSIAHDKVGHDSASVGLFQQQPYIPGRTWGWGTIGQCMDAAYSTNSFLASLLKIADRPSKAVTVLVQTVQRSAYPNAYAQWEALGWALLAVANAAPNPGKLPWVLAAGNYLGRLDGPDESHGGDARYDPPTVRQLVQNALQWLIYHGCVPSVPASAWATSAWPNSGWVAAYVDPACKAWHDRFYPGQTYPFRLYSDDYDRLTIP